MDWKLYILLLYASIVIDHAISIPTHHRRRPSIRTQKQMSTVFGPALQTMGCLPKFFCGMNSAKPSGATSTLNDLAYLIKFAMVDEDSEENLSLPPKGKNKFKEDLDSLEDEDYDTKKKGDKTFERLAEEQMIKDDPSVLNFIWKDTKVKIRDELGMEDEFLRPQKTSGSSSFFGGIKNFMRFSRRDNRRPLRRRAAFWETPSFDAQMEFAARVGKAKGTSIPSDKECTSTFNLCPYTINQMKAFVSGEKNVEEPAKVKDPTGDSDSDQWYNNENGPIKASSSTTSTTTQKPRSKLKKTTPNPISNVIYLIDKNNLDGRKPLPHPVTPVKKLKLKEKKPPVVHDDEVGFDAVSFNGPQEVIKKKPPPPKKKEEEEDSDEEESDEDLPPKLRNENQRKPIGFPIRKYSVLKDASKKKASYEAKQAAIAASAERKKDSSKSKKKAEDSSEEEEEEEEKIKPKYSHTYKYRLRNGNNKRPNKLRFKVLKNNRKPSILPGSMEADLAKKQEIAKSDEEYLDDSGSEEEEEDEEEEETKPVLGIEVRPDVDYPDLSKKRGSHKRPATTTSTTAPIISTTTALPPSIFISITPPANEKPVVVDPSRPIVPAPEKVHKPKDEEVATASEEEEEDDKTAESKESSEELSDPQEAIKKLFSSSKLPGKDGDEDASSFPPPPPPIANWAPPSSTNQTTVAFVNISKSDNAQATLTTTKILKNETRSDVEEEGEDDEDEDDEEDEEEDSPEVKKVADDDEAEAKEPLIVPDDDGKIPEIGDAVVITTDLGDKKKGPGKVVGFDDPPPPLAPVSKFPGASKEVKVPSPPPPMAAPGTRVVPSPNNAAGPLGAPPGGGFPGGGAPGGLGNALGGMQGNRGTGGGNRGTGGGNRGQQGQGQGQGTTDGDDDNSSEEEIGGERSSEEEDSRRIGTKRMGLPATSATTTTTTTTTTIPTPSTTPSSIRHHNNNRVPPPPPIYNPLTKRKRYRSNLRLPRPNGPQGTRPLSPKLVQYLRETYGDFYHRPNYHKKTSSVIMDKTEEKMKKRRRRRE